MYVHTSDKGVKRVERVIVQICSILNSLLGVSYCYFLTFVTSALITLSDFN